MAWRRQYSIAAAMLREWIRRAVEEAAGALSAPPKHDAAPAKHDTVSLPVPQVASPAAVGPHMRFQPESAARIACRVISCCHWYEMTRQTKQDGPGTCYPGCLCRMPQAGWPYLARASPSCFGCLCRMPQAGDQAGCPYLVSGTRPDRHPIQGACRVPHAPGCLQGACRTPICLSDAARVHACRVHPALDRVPMLLLVLTTSLTLQSMTSNAWRSG